MVPQIVPLAGIIEALILESFKSICINWWMVKFDFGLEIINWYVTLISVLYCFCLQERRALWLHTYSVIVEMPQPTHIKTFAVSK